MGAVLVTRPQPGARRTAQRLLALGYRAIELPLTAIVALPRSRDDFPAKFEAIVATSANALKHLPTELSQALANQPLYAVGPDTARFAREAGFTSIEYGSGDAAGLARLVSSRMQAGSEILYLCGKVRLGNFEQWLARSGLNVHAVETYDTQAVAHDARTLAIIGSEQVAAVLLYSGEAARHLVALAARDSMKKAIGGADLLCISARVAAALDGFAPGHIAIAERPSEDAMLFLLQTRQPREA